MKRGVGYYWLCIAVPVVLLAAGLFYGCGGGSGGGGGGGGGPPPPPTTGNAQVAAQIVDANDDTVLTSSNGPEGGFDVTYSYGGTTKKVNTKTGLVDFVTPNLNLGTVVNIEAVPLDVNGKVDANYLRNSISFAITQEGQNNFLTQKILITNLNNKPQGVTNGTGTTSCTNGEVAAPLTVTPAAGSAGAPTASVSIPAGTVLKDGTGQPLAGALTANVVYYSPTNIDAMKNLPGGLDNFAQTNGDTGAFITAGFLNVEIANSDRTQIAQAITGTPIEILLEIPSAIMNPDTGKQVAVGDKVPLWSFDSTKGQWKNEGETTVEAGGATGLRVRFNPGHFSCWNIGWFLRSTCTGTIHFIGNTVPLRVVVRATSGFGFVTVFRQPPNDDTKVIRFVPSGMPITVEAYADDTMVGSVQTTNWCAEPNRTLDLTVSIIGPTHRNVLVQWQCPTSPSTVKPAPFIPIFSCREPSPGHYNHCEFEGITNTSGMLSFEVADPSKVTVAWYFFHLYEAVGGVINLPNKLICPETGTTGGTGGSGTGTNF
jgi:hypothetical protein